MLPPPSKTSNHNYVQMHDHEVVKGIVAPLCPAHIDSILSEDVVCNEGFMSVAYSTALSYNEFRDLRSNYTA